MNYPTQRKHALTNDDIRNFWKLTFLIEIYFKLSGLANPALKPHPSIALGACTLIQLFLNALLHTTYFDENVINIIYGHILDEVVLGFFFQMGLMSLFSMLY